MRIQPKYTLIESQYVIFPIDDWSRKHIRNLCNDLNVSFIEVLTTMHTPAFQFTQQDYKNVTSFLKDFYINE